MGEISKSFQIKTGVRQGVGLSPTLFNIVLDKVVKTFWKGSGAIIGTTNQHVEVECLAFAHDLALFAESEQEAINQIDQLKEIAENTRLQISFRKTVRMTSDKKYSKKSVETKYGKVKFAKRKVNYLGKIIWKNRTDKKQRKHKN